MRASKMRRIVASHRKVTMTNWKDHQSWWSSQLHAELPKNSSSPFFSLLAFEANWRGGKTPKCGPHELTADTKKSLFWSIVFSYPLQQQWTISWLDCDVRLQVDFIYQPATTKSVVGVKRSSQAFPKARLAPRRDHSHCLEVCCLSDPLQFSESWQNHYIREVCSANWWDPPKTAVSAATFGQQKGPNSLLWQCWPHLTQPMVHNFNELVCKSLPHLPYSSDLSPTDYHFFKHLNNFLQGKCFHNQQEAENAFQEFVKSWSTDFYATGIIKFISCWQKYVDCSGSYFD